MPNTLLTTNEIGELLLAMARRRCKGDEKLMREVMESFAYEWMLMDMGDTFIERKRYSRHDKETKPKKTPRTNLKTTKVGKAHQKTRGRKMFGHV